VRVSVGDVRLFFEVLGEEWVFTDAGFTRRPTLLGLHGGPGLDGSKLRVQLAPLADVAQVIVPDQRGHGRSDRGSAETWNVTTWAADVKNLADALGGSDRWCSASRLAVASRCTTQARNPDHPAGAIVVSTPARPPTSEETIERFREIGGDEAAEVHRRDLEEPSEETAAEWARVCFPLLSRRREPDPILERLEAWRFENQSLDVNLHFRAAERTDLLPVLRGVRCPTLVLVGEHDPMVTTRQAHEVVDAIPDGLARLQPIREAAHDVPPTIRSRPTRAFARS
jgi:pimeloyl-ACP methyl ester carboxylesterase